MITVYNITNQTGAVEVELNFKPNGSNEFWQFAVNSYNNSGAAFYISGSNGRIYDMDGHFLYSYGYDDIKLKTLIETGNYSVFFDDTIVKNAAKSQLDINTVLFATTSSEQPTVSAKGEKRKESIPNSIFFTEDATGDQDFINFANYFSSRMDLSTRVTGEDLTSNLSYFEDIDCVFFGNAGSGTLTGDAEFWSNLDATKIFFYPETAEQYGIIDITGYQNTTSGDCLSKNSAITKKVADSGQYFPFLECTGEIAMVNGADSAVEYSQYGIVVGEIEASGGNYFFFNLPSGFSGISDEARQCMINTVFSF